ncbi:DNA-binding protein [archaeon]|nr:DNA-binding protein [archaeon]|tara:strand:+ start:1405 stop:1743 length:339 start_codon:yes stop_codon:yes gene_type:complete
MSEENKPAEDSAKPVVEQKIKELDSNSRSVNLTATVVKMEEPREITTKFGRTMVANADIEDDTDKIKLVLWGDQTQACKEGDKIKVTNAYVKEWNGEKQLSIGKYGKMEKIE